MVACASGGPNRIQDGFPLNFYVTALVYVPTDSSPREVYYPLAGPFSSHAAAESAVPLARKRMTDADETLHFTPVGVTRTEITMRVVFPDITEQPTQPEMVVTPPLPVPTEPEMMVCPACTQVYPVGANRRFPLHSDPQSTSTVYANGRVYRTPCRMSNTFYPESQC